MQRVAARIETELDGPLSLTALAATAHLSPHHFARLFRALTGDSVMGYVRARRLARAVELLACDKSSILDVALACGFGSNEALTRAFRRHFGLTPGAYRRNAPLLHLPTRERLTMSEPQTTPPITPSFEHRDAFCAVGMPGEFRPGATADIGALWQRFVPRMDEIGNRVGSATYGICCLPEEGPRDPENFTYLAAVAVADLDSIPAGMTGVEVPARDYAVFTYDGGIGPELPKTMQYIFGEWLPGSGFELDGADFEYYDDRFDPETNTGTFFICLPVRRP